MKQQYDDPIEEAVLGTTVDCPVGTDAGDDDQPTHFTLAIYGLIFLLGVLAALGPLSIDMYLPSFPAIAKELGVTVPAVQQTLASYFVGLAIGQLFYGPASDRWGRKVPLYVGLASFGLAAVGCAMAHSLQSLIALRFLQGLGGCAEMVIARAIVRDRFKPRDAVRVFSGLVLVMGVAPIVAPLMGGWIVSHLDWRWIFWLLAIVSVVTIGIVAVCLPESLPPERRVRETPAGIARIYGSLLRDAPFMAFALVTGLISAALFAYVGSSPTVFIETFGISPKLFGWFFGANAAGLIGMAQVNGQLIRRGADPRRVLLTALSVASVSGALLLFFAITGVGGFWAIYGSIFACMSCCGFIFPNATALAMAPHGRYAGNASALLGFVQFGLSGLGGFAETLTGHGAKPSPLPMAVALAVCTVSALAIAAVMTRRATTVPMDAALADAGH